MSVSYSSDLSDSYADDFQGLRLYESTSYDVYVGVHPIYLDEQSIPSENHYVWAYRVTIKNHRTDVLQIRARTWQIIDATGILKEIHGPGIVGQMPVLNTGGIFEYTSGVSLTGPSGVMTGTYQATNEEGDIFDIVIPPFSLDSPYQAIVMN